ncbi:MAG TPA: acyltransferase, partial [Dokdonella sp.]
FCLGLYRGGNRYEIHFEAFADEIVLSRRERQGELRALAQRYAARLEHYVRDAPYNWFNWHDFWEPDPARADDARLARAAVSRGAA